MASTVTGDDAKRVVGERFVLTQLIGEGGFAHVYRARDTESGNEVAIKLLKERLRSDADIVERFRREIFAVASIDSPYVVRLHDFGISDADVFIAMEFVEGPTLRDLLGAEPLSPDAAQMVVGQIAQAVRAAHDKGIVHRDLKPENVILVRGARGRQVKVLDFGLAKLVDLEQQLGLQAVTREGFCFGTPQYLSPERIRGRATERSDDLWALAVMAYEIVSGRLPWDGNDPREVMYAVIGEALPTIASAHPSLVRLDAVNRYFARALSRNLEERPADAATLFGEFEQALFGGPRAPAESVFTSVLAAEFAAPTIDTLADTEPGTPLTDAELLSVTPDTTRPGKRRSSSKRRLRSLWSAHIEPAQSGSTTVASRKQPIAEPSPSARVAPAPVPLAAVTPPVTTEAKAAPSEQRHRLRPAWLLAVALLLALVAALGYALGRAPHR